MRGGDWWCFPVLPGNESVTRPLLKTLHGGGNLPATLVSRAWNASQTQSRSLKKSGVMTPLCRQENLPKSTSAGFFRLGFLRARKATLPQCSNALTY